MASQGGSSKAAGSGQFGASLVSCAELKLSYGQHHVLDGATLAVHERDRIGLVGRNGCGKSSFLRILAGESEADSGEIARRSSLVTGFLPQEFRLREDATVLENARDGAGWILEMLEQYESGEGSEGERLESLQDRIDAVEGWTVESRVEALLDSLDCPAAERKVAELSGGEKRRVALCGALAGRPDLLILDEPTNHLDAETIEWLEGFLAGYSGAVVFVTHDRYFLERLANRMVELDGGRLFAHEGNYDDYLEAKALRQEIDRNAERRRRSFLNRELEWVRAGVKARTTKARSRLDAYHEVAAQSGPREELDVELVLPPAASAGNIVVDLEGVGLSLGGKRLFQHLDLRFEAGRCLGIVGRNGLGKTSLLRLVLGELEPDEGQVVIGKRTRFNYVDQNRTRLEPTRSILEEVGEGSEHMRLGDETITVRAWLRRFLFTDDRVHESIEMLSGGERSRVVLAKMLKNGGNFLVLDEPTNDLDLPTLRVLEETLLAYTGTAVVVSHDRYFLDRVSDQILSFEGEGSVVLAEGNWSYYQEKRRERERRRGVERANADGRDKGTHARSGKSEGASDASRSKRRPGLRWKEERELEAIEPRIETLEAEQAEIEATLSDPAFYRERAVEAPALTERRDALQEEIESLYARWQELESLKAGGGPDAS